MEELNQVGFNSLKPNSLYTIKFSNSWKPDTINHIMRTLNVYGKDYKIKFISLIAGMEIANGEEADVKKAIQSGVEVDGAELVESINMTIK